MKRSDRDIDRLLREWDAVASAARRPSLALRPTVRSTGALPVSAVLVGVLAIGAVALLGRAAAGPAQDASSPAGGPALVTGVAENDPFRLTLTVDRATWTEGEDIHAVARVEYKGPLAEVTVGHALSAVTFGVDELGGGRRVDGGVRLLCTTTTYRRGEPQDFPWSRSGGVAADDPDADFVRRYLGDGPPDAGTLRLPAGTWTLSATLDVFDTGCDLAERGRPLVATVEIAVLPATAVASPSASPKPSSVPTPAPSDLPIEVPLSATGTADDGRFRVVLAADRTTYAEGEDIRAQATVSFLGPEPELVVGHGSPMVTFTVEEVGGGRTVGGGVDTVCLRSTFAAGEPRAFPWQRSGGYSTSDPGPNDRFAMEYLRGWNGAQDGELRLPAGTWGLSAVLDVAELECGPPAPRTASITIRVLPAGGETGSPPPATRTPTPVVAEPGDPGEVDLSPVVRCGRIGPVVCEGAIGLVHELVRDDYERAVLVVVDDNCRPGTLCDRQYPYDMTVVIVGRGEPPVEQVAFHVYGDDEPERFEFWRGDLPPWIQDLVDLGTAPEPGVELFPLITADPLVPGALRECPAAVVRGVLAEDERWGIGFVEGTRVTWPFGWAGRRDANGVTLVDATGSVRGRVGEPFEGGGGWGEGDRDAVVCG